MNTTIQLNIDTTTRDKAQKILKKTGLDLLSGIKMFLNNIVRNNSIPMDLRTENGFTPAQEKKILREIAWAKKHGKRFSTPEEAIAYLNS